MAWLSTSCTVCVGVEHCGVCSCSWDRRMSSEKHEDLPTNPEVESHDEEEESEEYESQLGKKEHWDSAYALELENFASHGDIGEVWFGEDTADKVVELIDTLPSVHKQTSFIDLGCGNGAFVLSLLRQGYRRIMGTDYSEDGVRLSEQIIGQFRAEHSEEPLDVRFAVDDLLHSTVNEQFDVVHDKGTFDAIRLNSEAPAEAYREALMPLVVPGGFFVITSCNWTHDELLEYFQAVGLRYHDRVAYPTRRVFGQDVSPVRTVAFQRPLSS
eukprot:gnl/Trimastix_PCT/1966.p2 GENE.gnl/Trimastix_PCT/1966~~gnl/Trimastix_PCT/1966.p2  ORF type:complete len:270 (-),score=44.59 gnl/Trimastix_PCT/1966:124-933(-)